MGLEELLKAAVASAGYCLADWERANRGRLLRVYIEKPAGDADPQGGISLADCEAASRQLQRVLEVEGVDYDRLEVSSPGLDRRLKTAADFERFTGHEADVHLRHLVNGRRHVVGVVKRVVRDAVRGESVELQAETGPFSFELADLKRARLVPKL